MSDSKDSTVTYMAVSIPFEGLSNIGSPGVDGPPMMPEDSYAYMVASFQAPPSPDYGGLLFLSLYTRNSDPEEDEEDPEEDPTNYPADRGDDDDDDESSDDDEDDDDDVEKDEDEEEEHPAPADSVPPPSEAEIARLLAIPSPPPSPLSLWSSPLPQIPSPPLPVSSPVPVSPPPLPASPTYHLGYRAAMIWLRAKTPSTSHPLPLMLPFEEGKLLVKYLGVPLVSSRLKIRDCLELVDKVSLRIQDWKNKSLSMAGRLQLIQAVLGSLHIFWASVFIIPNQVLLNIEQLMRQFLWCHGSSTKGKSTVAWETVCLPKREGGLGIRRLHCFNSALMSSHIWKLLTLKESLWVKWVHEYKIKDRNFWDIPLRGNMSWGWRKILSLRPSIRKFIRSKLGNGMNTSLWFDTWSVLEPIASFVSPRDIARAGLSLRSNVMDIIQQGTWVWPRDLLIKHPVLSNYNLPIIDDAVDSLEWYDRNGNAKKFLVSQVWDDIRCRDNHVEWYSMVWFSACIPRHALNMWLIFRRIWDRIKRLAGLERYPPNIYDIFHTMLPFINRRTTCSVVAKLLIAAAAYYVWQERNWRLFKKGKRSPDQLVECIRSSVRLRLFSCTFKKSKDGERMAKLWDLPEAIFR
ncbi:hypothetical protein Tco_1417205 [Tanacetum coccineum]